MCLVPWSLLGEGEPSLDVREAGSPCSASAFRPAPKAGGLGGGLPCSVQPLRENRCRQQASCPCSVLCFHCFLQSVTLESLPHGESEDHVLTPLPTVSTYLSMIVGNPSPYPGRERLLKGKFCV